MKRHTSLQSIFVIIMLVIAQVGQAYAYNVSAIPSELQTHTQTGKQSVSMSNKHEDCDMQMASSAVDNAFSAMSIDDTYDIKHSTSMDCCDGADGNSCCEMECHCVAFSASMVFLESDNMQSCSVANSSPAFEYINCLLSPHASLPKRPPILNFS